MSQVSQKTTVSSYVTITAAQADYVARFLEGFADDEDADKEAIIAVRDALYAVSNDTDAVIVPNFGEYFLEPQKG